MMQNPSGVFVADQDEAAADANVSANKLAAFARMCMRATTLLCCAVVVAVPAEHEP